MAKTVTLIRHAETNSNRVGRWQGSADSGISPHGEDQLAALAGRQNGWRSDVLVSSDLSRAMRTASVIGDAIPDSAWREFHVGGWEGMTSAEITERYPGEMEAFLRGEDIAPGGGEQMSTFGRRVATAFDAIVASLGDGQNAVVVTHGGVIWAIMANTLGVSLRPLKMIPSHNTASTVIRIGDDGARQVAVFNDATHLTNVPTQFGPVGTTVSLYRHGQSEGNLAGRWQGRTDSPLTPVGRDQVAAASVVAPPIEELFTSPLGRTVETAAIIGDALGVAHTEDGGFIEMSFGRWENMTTAEAAVQDPELFRLIFEEGQDLPRGRDGESFAQAGVRVAAAVESIAGGVENGHIAAVSHGAAIRAFITSVMGLTFATRDRFPIPRNSSLSQVRISPTGPVLAAYNVAPHMDS